MNIDELLLQLEQIKRVEEVNHWINFIFIQSIASLYAEYQF